MISIISPVYGCYDSIEELSRRVSKSFEGAGLDWELIFVDDRGPVDSWPIIKKLSEENPHIRGVRLTHNHGQHLAIWAGLAECRGDWVAVIDCDLQDDPEIIPQLYAKAIDDRVEAVIVERGVWKDKAWRRVASNLFHKLIKMLSGILIDNNIGNFGIYSRRMVEILLSFKDKEVFLPVMVALTGLSRSTYQLDRSEREAGSSSYNLIKLVRMAVAIIVRFSDRPLKLSIIIGGLISGVSALFSIYIFIAWAFGSFTVPGWTSLILSIWFLAGLILAVLGIHGFYIGRIFSETQRRPRILVECRTDQCGSKSVSKLKPGIVED